MNKEFSDLTLEVTAKLSKVEKKNGGVFMTPYSIVDKILELIPDIEVKDILEPSCGTCQFIDKLDRKYKNVNITGVELNKTIFDSINTSKYTNKVDVINDDFVNAELKYYDLIVGNPPFLVCDKKKVPEEYERYIDGRPNLFGLFIVKSLCLLRNGGVIAFVLPMSILNAAYYNKVRDFLIDICTVIHLEKLPNKFLETKQSTYALVVQRRITQPHPFVVRINYRNILSCNAFELEKVLNRSTTIERYAKKLNINIRVKTGDIVWNQVKSKLTNEKKTFLIYSSNIVSGKIIDRTFGDEVKKQYIDAPGYNYKALVVNRGNGNSKYKLQYALVELDNYRVENHLNVIFLDGIYGDDERLDIFNKIMRSFKDKRTQLFIDLYLGNGGLSKTELFSVFPIFI